MIDYSDTAACLANKALLRDLITLLKPEFMENYPDCTPSEHAHLLRELSTFEGFSAALVNGCAYDWVCRFYNFLTHWELGIIIKELVYAVEDTCTSYDRDEILNGVAEALADYK